MPVQHTATQTATNCDILQYTATHCNTLQHLDAVTKFGSLNVLKVIVICKTRTRNTSTASRCCSVFQCGAVCCGVAVCFGVVQCVAACCSVSQCVGTLNVKFGLICKTCTCNVSTASRCCGVLQCVVCCSVLLCAEVCCSVLVVSKSAKSQSFAEITCATQHTNKSCHMYECVTSHIQRSHVTHTKESPTRSRSRLLPSLELRSLSRARTLSRSRFLPLSLCVYAYGCA